VVTHQLQVERGTGKVCRSKTGVLPLCHILPATHTFIHEWNEPSCIHFLSIHQMASP